MSNPNLSASMTSTEEFVSCAFAAAGICASPAPSVCDAIASTSL